MTIHSLNNESADKFTVAVNQIDFAFPRCESIRVESEQQLPLSIGADEISSIDPAMESPRAVKLRLQSPPISVNSYAFPPLPEWAAAAKKPAKPKKNRGGGATDSIGERKHTRIKPPKDVIKMQDRLYYLLQPPLEMLATSSLEFPFDPFPYQYEGIAFLYPRFTAILADEMGLGKTMQAISTIRMLLHSGEIRSVLLVCPKPLVTNWQREFSLWAPEIPLSIVEGNQETRRFQWLQPQAPVKIANYELLMRDQDIVTDGTLHFDLVALDEAQRIKNRSSTTSTIVKSIPRTRSWALTGTPVENSADDLVGIFDFLSPGYLNSNMRPRAMGKAVGDYILRRTKDKVLTEMPPKLYRDADLSLTPEQQLSYSAAEDDGVMHLNEMGEEISIQHVFELVLRLKQICNFDPRTGASCKLERLKADLEEVAASGQKAIVFSQWTKTIAKISEGLQRFHPLEYHGKIPSKKRDDVLARFKEDPKHSVLLMSYGAGSVGLNLQFCRYVFLFDRWWNPAVEDQAINRAHRIGAAGSVTVTRMLAVGTIEERIDQVLQEKREMFEAILSQTGKPKPKSLTQKEIFGLFDLRIRKPAA